MACSFNGSRRLVVVAGLAWLMVASMGFAGATPTPTPTPRPICGNGEVEGYEECDNGTRNSDTRPDQCRTDCVNPRCGDGVTDSGEECDRGAQNSNLIPGECRLDCRRAHCGDGVVDHKLGEECDGGPGCTGCLLCVVPYDGMNLTADTTLCPGVHTLADGGAKGVVTVTGSGVVIDGKGAVIVAGSNQATLGGTPAPSKRLRGTGIVVRGEAVVLRDLTVAGFETGLELTVPGTQLQRVTACSNSVDIVRVGDGSYGFQNRCAEARSWSDGGRPGCSSGCEGALPKEVIASLAPPASADVPSAASRNRGTVESKNTVNARTMNAAMQAPAPTPTPAPVAPAKANMAKMAATGGFAAPAPQGQCQLRGEVKGQFRYVGSVAVLTSDGRRQVTAAKLTRGGEFNVTGLAAGQYVVQPLPGGKFDLVAEPARRTISCAAGGELNIAFTIRGIRE